MTNTIRTRRALILLGALAATFSTVACSRKNNQQNLNTPAPVAGVVRPAALHVNTPISPKDVSMTVTENAASPEKPLSKTITYKSRDYGVSFLYPRQYAYKSAKAISLSGDESILPKADGFEGQFTLVRIDVPKGYYPDTNFDSGYLTLSLNQDVSEEECHSSLHIDRSGETAAKSINGVEFRWIETENGGHGSASKVRNFVTYANGTCYEIEAGVKTRNEQGLSREVDPDKVFSRLDAILETVKIQVEQPKTEPELKTEVEEPKTISQK